MSDKTALLREENEAFADLHRAIDGLSEEQMGRVWLGTWGVREILVHISGWHHELGPALERLSRGEKPYEPGAYDDFDAWNARFVEEKVGVKTAEVLAGLDAARETFVKAAASVPERYFAAGGAAREPFEGAGAAHYREHAAQIREWRERARL
jgi:hypothetical protein